MLSPAGQHRHHSLRHCAEHGLIGLDVGEVPFGAGTGPDVAVAAAVSVEGGAGAARHHVMVKEPLPLLPPWSSAIPAHAPLGLTPHLRVEGLVVL